MKSTPTQQQVSAALHMMIAVADSIKELKSVPSGHLYAQLMGRVDLETYEAMIRTLVNTGLVKEDGVHILTWDGPAA